MKYPKEFLEWLNDNTPWHYEKNVDGDYWFYNCEGFPAAVHDLDGWKIKYIGELGYRVTKNITHWSVLKEHFDPPIVYAGNVYDLFDKFIKERENYIKGQNE